MEEALGALITRFGSEFPTIGREVIVRQLRDAADSVQLFAFPAEESNALIERLVRSHLEALAALRQE